MLGNFTSGQLHANEKVTVRCASAGILTVAAIAAPMDDPGSEGTEIPAGLRLSKDPCYSKTKQISTFSNISL